MVKEEEVEEDAKDLSEILERTAAGSANIHVKGRLSADKLMPRNMHRCELCEFTAMTQDKVIAHTEGKHKIFHCRFCNTYYPSKLELNKHRNVCEELLAMRAKVRQQVDQMKDPKSEHVAIKCMMQPVKCPICKGQFESMFEMGDARRHPCKSYSVRLFACSGCKMQFSTTNGLKSHLIARYNENALACFDAGVLSYESRKKPKFFRPASHITYCEPEIEGVTPISRNIIPIKAEPTEEDEMHSKATQHALVTAHLLSDYKGGVTKTDYYYAMRQMFYKINCPFCGIMCRTLAALHTHALTIHSPHDRCLYQCAGCQATFQTPTGLGQHLKRQFDEGIGRCYNTVNLVKKEDYCGPVRGWNKTNPKVKQEEPDSSHYPPLFLPSEPSMDYRSIPADYSTQSSYGIHSGVAAVKEEPEDEYKPDIDDFSY